MKRYMITIFGVALLQGMGIPATARCADDMGSAECRRVQLAAYDMVENQGPYKNHGQVMETVNLLVAEKIQNRTISGRCAACIREQFAQQIPPEHQKACGLDEQAQAALDFAVGSFERIRSIIGPEDESLPTTKFIGTHIEVKSEFWVYILDSTGYQVFRPISVHSHIQSASGRLQYIPGDYCYCQECRNARDLVHR